ncbi:MAG: hypothetical protein H6613_13945 [Ignavibacteriales bacterium]|nr:hypothetical protein [Ignavibacteriales bacterium]
MKTKSLIILLFLASFLFASDHGIYLLTNKSVPGTIEEIQKMIVSEAGSNGFTVLKSKPIYVPDYVREEKDEHCGFKAHLIVLASDNYTKMLTSYGSKYLVAAFLRIGIYETPEGTNIEITDPETINRIVFNDLYENDKESIYKEVIAKTKTYKNNLIKLLHNAAGGEKLEKNMPPIRDDEDLAESSRDMFMMVGPLTLFNDEDQFPIIYSIDNKDGFAGLQKLKSEFISNLKTYKPTKDDKDYRWFQNESDLIWQVISTIESPKKDAILLGLTRPRTEAVSFNIAGSSREEEGNMCPGIDHASSYPVEVLLIQEGDKINVYTQKQMHRMDMYFWDAGMSAFMDHMSMPGILDESLKRSLLGNKFISE